MFNLGSQQKKIKGLVSRLFQKNRYESELEDYLALATEHPDDTRVWLKIAETYFKAKEIPQAIEAYEKVAESYIKDNFFLKAVAIYKNILKINPHLVEVNLKMAELYSKLGSTSDVVNQYRIAMQHFEMEGDKEQLVQTGQKLLAIDPSPVARRKMAEIYQNIGMTAEAMEQYEILAREFRLNKQYDDLLRTYELILPHKPKNQPLIRDICILYLRRQEPDYAIRIMERYHVDNEPDFATLYDKAKAMREALRKQPGKK